MRSSVDSGLDPNALAGGEGVAPFWRKDFYRIGHSGASGHAHPNTLESFALALDMGVDMIEFDVLPCRDDLVLLHDDDLSHVSDEGDGRRASKSTVQELKELDLGAGQRIPTLAEALDFLRSRAPINVDLKAAGYERAVIAHLQERRMLGEALISSMIAKSLAEVRRISAEVKTGLSYPLDRGPVFRRKPLRPLVLAALALLRKTLPRRIVDLMTRARADAVMLNFMLVSQKAVARVHAHGGRVFVWTVDDAEHMASVRSLGVDGIASNYPELFAAI